VIRDLTEYEKRRNADLTLLTAVVLFTDSTSDAVGVPQHRSDVRRLPSCMARVRYCYSLTVGYSTLACRAHVQERAMFVVWYYLSSAAHQWCSSRRETPRFTDNQSRQQSRCGGWSG